MYLKINFPFTLESHNANSKNNNTISKIKNDLKLKNYYNYIKILKLYILKNI